MKNYQDRLKDMLEVNPFISYKDAVYEILRTDIISGVYPPHHKLVEYRIAEEFGTSRTPIKQAFELLEKQGFIYIKASTGSYVAPYNAAAFADLFLVRYNLEKLAAAQACERATLRDLKNLFRYSVEMDKAYQHYGEKKSDEAENNFHNQLILCSHNDYLIDAYKSIALQIQRFRQYVTNNWKDMESDVLYSHLGTDFSTGKIYQFRTQIGYEHYLIYQAIYNRSVTAAMAALTFVMAINNPAQVFY